MFTATEVQPARIIETRLSVIRRRMQFDLFLNQLARFGFWGLILVGILLILNRFFPLPFPMSLAIPLPIAIGFFTALCVSLLRRTDIFAVARRVDNRLNLKERLSTALDASKHGQSEDDLVRLQTEDAAHVARAIVPAASFPYTSPPMLKWIPLALLLIASAFVIPRMYEMPPPLTEAESAAIVQAADAIESELNGIGDTELARKMRDTISELRDKDINVNQSQAELSRLRNEVRAKKSQIARGLDTVAKTVSETDKLTTHLKGRTANEIASDLEKIANQLETFTPAQRAALETLLKKIAQRLGENPDMQNFPDQLSEIQTEEVSAELLKRIAQALVQSTNEIAQLDRVLQQIKSNRRNIALAGIDFDRKTSGVPSGGTGSGDDSDAAESQEAKTVTNPPPFSPPSNNSLTDFKLTAPPSDSQAFTQVYVDEDPTGEGEPTYMPYREAHLHARQAYARAIERDEIPLKYRAQVKAYLEAIANLESKDPP